MKKTICALAIAGVLIASPAFAGTRTVEIVTATGLVQAVVTNTVTTPAPAGMTFIVVTNDSTKVDAGWHYNSGTGAFTPPS